MSNVVFNNFSAGVVTPKLSGQYNGTAYRYGARKIRNMCVMLQGGLTRRPPLMHMATLHQMSDGASTDGGARRIIPFKLNGVTHIVCLRHATVSGTAKCVLDVWSDGIGGWTKAYTHDYQFGETGARTVGTATQLDEVQWCQNSDTLFLVHRGHTPKKLTYSSGFQLTDISPVLQDDIHLADTENIGMLTAQNDHPSCVAFLYNRLWFASSTNHPNRLWASRPFKAENFEMYDVEETLNDSTVGSALQTWFDTNKSKLNDPTQTIPDFTVSDSISYEKVYREDVALRLDTDGTDSILWISAKNNLLLGTNTGEYVIAGDVSGTNQKLTKISGYGSKNGVQPVIANNDVLFCQGSGTRLRSLSYTSDGYSCIDMTYQTDVLDVMTASSAGIRHMAWRRTPESTLYAVTVDGRLKVLSYDRSNGMIAWTEWDTDGDVIDVLSMDTDFGQDVCVVVSRKDAQDNVRMFLERFAEPLHDTIVHFRDRYVASTDNPGAYDNRAYTSEVRTNPYEFNSSGFGSSLGKYKRITEMTVRTMDTKHMTAFYFDMNRFSDNGRYAKAITVRTDAEGNVDVNDTRISIGGGYMDNVCLYIGSMNDEQMTVLAIAVGLEV